MQSKTRITSHCPLSNTLDLIGDKWTLIVIRDLCLGKTHFKEFSESTEQIATNILSNRLRKLLKHQFISTCASPLYPGRKAYQLTERGLSLKPLIQHISNWGLENIPNTTSQY